MQRQDFKVKDEKEEKQPHFIGVEQCIGNTVVMFQKSKMILMKICATRVFSSLHFKNWHVTILVCFPPFLMFMFL